eukprot:Selendium_serpulae@DN5275_c0_g1_i1.p2
MDVTMETRTDLALIAVQGPLASQALQPLVKAMDLLNTPFMHGRMTPISGVAGCTVTRCGYTGEDGFELSIPKAKAEAVTRELLENAHVKLCGLAARDSLRLEAGLCLYGHDIDETTSPVEAGLLWTISKARRQEGGFLGADTVQRHIKDGVTRKRVGLHVKGGIAREGASILDPSTGESVGRVTSGTHCPTVDRAVAMGYVATALSKTGTQLQIDVKGKPRHAEVTKMPFLPNNFYKVPGQGKK